MKRLQITCYSMVFLFFLGLYIPSLWGHATVFFSPDDKPTSHLVAAINGSKTRLYSAIYMFTDKNIAQAVINAKKRGVKVQVVTDRSSYDSEYGKIKLLKDNGIDIFIFDPQVGNRRSKPIMHNKFAVIDNDVLTGSFNWTIAANKMNQENLVWIKNEPHTCQRYCDQFEKLKRRCVYHKIAENEPAKTPQPPSLDTGMKHQIMQMLKKARQKANTVLGMARESLGMA